MKKTLSVNLGGIVYHIDEDAYSELMEYLQDVKRHLGDEASSEEVLNDIEQRISELFTQWMQGQREVITVADVQKVLAFWGVPSSMKVPKRKPRLNRKRRLKPKAKRVPVLLVMPDAVYTVIQRMPYWVEFVQVGRPI